MRTIHLLLLLWLGGRLAFAQNVTQIEYFVDTDPGYGSATQVTGFTAAAEINNINFTVQASPLSNGFHRLFVRANDANGKWSLVSNHLLFKEDLPVALPNVSQMEYFIDADPGYGLGTAVSITSGTVTNDRSFIISVNTLSTGFHRLFIRAKDTYSKWSIVSNHLFFRDNLVATIPNTVKIEYFFDSDPGYGLATDVPVNQGTAVSDKHFTIPVNSLSKGVHRLFVRAKDANGGWSVVSNHLVYKDLIPATLPDIVKVEYFIDTDPGFGNASDVPVAPGTDVNGLNFNVPLTTTTIGDHKLFIRAKDANGGWSIIAITDFNTQPPLPVTLLNFNAKKQESKVRLDWKTTEETNSDYFEIQHSTDGKQWTEIGNVAASGESKIIKRYSFTHGTPELGENLYRLKMVDRDDSFAFSRVVSVLFENNNEIVLFPNPASDLLTVTSLTTIKGYKLITAGGQVIRNYQPAKDSRKLEVELGHVTPGLYIIHIVLRNGQTEYRKLVIK